MKYNFGTTPWLSIALIVSVTACQGRSRQTMVVEREDNSGAQQAQPGGTTPPPGTETVSPDAGPEAAAAAGGDVIAAAKANKDGKVIVNGWTGDADEAAEGNAWSVAKGSVGAGATVAPSTTPPPTTATVPAGTPASAAVTYDGKIQSVLGQCIRCHGPGGTNTPAIDTYDAAKANITRIIARSQTGAGMPPGGSVPAADLQALQAWQSSGMQKAAAAGAAGGAAATVPAAGNGLTLEITDQKFGNYLNNTVITGKVGQTLKIVNKRQQGSFIIHTDGAPFDHGDVGNPIPPGGSQDYQFQSPYNGQQGVYEHTDGSVNTDRLIKLQVTQ